MALKDMYPSNYLKKEELKSPVLAVISHLKIEALKNEGGTEDKPILFFSYPQGLKPLVLNVGNCAVITALYGEPDPDGQVAGQYWNGKQIEIYVDPTVRFGSKIVGGLRVRAPSTPGWQPTAAPPSWQPPAAAPPPVAMPQRSAGVWSWAQAVDEAKRVGVSEEILKEALKTKGLKGYKDTRDTAVVKQILEESTRMPGAPPPPPQTESDEIPF